jgi:formylglycine-generating enzyme required for sulfatase activity
MQNKHLNMPLFVVYLGVFLSIMGGCHAKNTRVPEIQRDATDGDSSLTQTKANPVNPATKQTSGCGNRNKKQKVTEPRSIHGSRFVPITKQESIREALKRIAGKWVKIPKGSFWMGSPKNEVGRFNNEIRHRVTLTNDFLMKATEVTKKEFKGAMGYDPSYYRRGRLDRPVNQVTWHEAALYCNRVSELVGLSKCYICKGKKKKAKCQKNTVFKSIYQCPGVRLPTEAEWEYAARAGKSTATYNGDFKRKWLGRKTNLVLDPIAWYAGNSVATSEVGQKKPNDWGFYDILGNVDEWCHNWFERKPTTRIDPQGRSGGKERSIRGGSFMSFPRYVRAAARDADWPSMSNSSLGFRPVVSIVPCPSQKLIRQQKEE